jgi:hypothetical protein
MLLDFLQKKERREGLDFLLVQRRPAAPLRTGAERSRRCHEPSCSVRCAQRSSRKRGEATAVEKRKILPSFPS